MVILVISFIILSVILFKNIYVAFREKFNDKTGILKSFVLAFILTLIFLYPVGIVNFEKWEGKDLLVAQRPGAAGCNSIFKLKENNKFVETIVCFGVQKIKGEYSINNDTIFFKNVSPSYEKKYYQFAIIKDSLDAGKDDLGELVFYKTLSDSKPLELRISKNEIKQ